MAQLMTNDQGGVGYRLSPEDTLDRLLLMGSEGAVLLAREEALTVEKTPNLVRMIGQDPLPVVARAVQINKENRAPRINPSLFVLAYAWCKSPSKHRWAIRTFIEEEFLNLVRTGTHLFTFVDYLNSMGGLGARTRALINKWYTQSPKDVAYQVTKYRQRGGWSHRDVLRKTHPKPTTPFQDALYKNLVSGTADFQTLPQQNEQEALNYLQVVDEVRRATDTSRVCKLVADYKLPWEVLPTEQLALPAVWEALLPHIPATALLRNLGRLSSLKLLTSGSCWEEEIYSRIDRMAEKGGIHPLQYLITSTIYANGRGEKGSLAWSPVLTTMAALSAAFYKSF